MTTWLLSWRRLTALTFVAFALCLALLAWRVSAGADPALTANATTVAVTATPTSTSTSDSATSDDGTSSADDGTSSADSGTSSADSGASTPSTPSTQAS